MKLRRVFYEVGNILDRIYNFLLFKYRHVQYGDDLRINGRLFCFSNSAEGIVIGNNVTINSSRKSNPIGGDTKTILYAEGEAKICIGNNSGISNTTIFSCASVTIGDSVLIGNGVKIYDTDFHWLDYKMRMSKPGGRTEPVVIKSGVFVGAHSIILKGVTIGERSIIGAGSVVTKSIPSGEIWAGNPAKFIRKI